MKAAFITLSTDKKWFSLTLLLLLLTCHLRRARAPACVLTQAITNKYTSSALDVVACIRTRIRTHKPRPLLNAGLQKKTCEVQDLLTYNRRKCERDKFQFILGFMKVIFFFRFKKTTHKSEFHFELLPPATLFLITSLSD